jgi:hypothetical protein
MANITQTAKKRVSPTVDSTRTRVDPPTEANPERGRLIGVAIHYRARVNGETETQEGITTLELGIRDETQKMVISAKTTRSGFERIQTRQRGSLPALLCRGKLLVSK